MRPMTKLQRAELLTRDPRAKTAGAIGAPQAHMHRSVFFPHNAAVNPERAFSRAIGLNGLFGSELNCWRS
jgi:hypothetical protein